MKQEIDLKEGLSIISHEIKNSLAGLKLGFDVLHSLSGNEGKEIIEILTEELRHLRQLTMDTLTLTGPMNVNLEEIDMTKLSRETVKIVLGNMGSNKPSISFEFSEGFPPVLCDRNLMKSVLMNLLKNACEEVGDKGAIQIGGMYLGDEMVEMWVKDNGRGIEGNIDSIFRKFKSTKGGVGIGLCLVRKIVYEHFGKVEVESTPGEGTKFIIEMPSDFRFIDRRSGRNRRKIKERRKEDK